MTAAAKELGHVLPAHLGSGTGSECGWIRVTDALRMTVTEDLENAESLLTSNFGEFCASKKWKFRFVITSSGL